MTHTSSRPAVVCIVGAGGLGCSAAWGIAAGYSGPPPLELHIFDPDRVELSNLPRQVLFTEECIGHPKAERLAAALSRECTGAVQAIPTLAAVTIENIDKLLRGATFVLDATDSVETKFLLNDYCVANKIPFCYGGAVGYAGVALATNPAVGGACLRCLFGDLDEATTSELGPTCRQAGILGPVVGAIGFAQARFALDYLANPSSLDHARLLTFDLQRLQCEETTLAPERSCTLGCSARHRKLLDLADKRCPQTFLLTKLALERLDPGESLDIQLGAIESVENVRQSSKEHGFSLLAGPTRIAANRWRMLLAKDPGEAQ